jgi:hypothetical protein
MSKLSRDDLLKLLAKCSPRTRKTVMRVIEGKVSQDDAPFVQEQVSMLEPDLTVRQIDFVSSRLCDSGHALDQQTRLIGQCQHRGCSAYVCSHPECGYTCCCGRLFCRRHVHVYGAGEAYCSRCHPVALLRWLIMGKRR